MVRWKKKRWLCIETLIQLYWMWLFNTNLCQSIYELCSRNIAWPLSNPFPFLRSMHPIWLGLWSRTSPCPGGRCLHIPSVQFRKGIVRWCFLQVLHVLNRSFEIFMCSGYLKRVSNEMKNEINWIITSNYSSNNYVWLCETCFSAT